jgi:hypothetical protein
MRCWSADAKVRPSFFEIWTELRALDYKILPGVKSKKVADFVEKIDSWQDQQHKAIAAEG